MNLFEVYSLLDIEPTKAKGDTVWDKDGNEYLDLYGGHAVISIGHSHPHYISKLSEQLNDIGFYSNSVINNLQVELAEKLGKLSGYNDYSLFLCNSGAEANENALKLASFKTGNKKVIAFNKAFHGRTSAAVECTYNNNIKAEINKTNNTTFFDYNIGSLASIEKELKSGDYCAVIIEGIQGIGGIHYPGDDMLKELRRITQETSTPLILDEIQSGYGRSGKFFAHQYSGIKADIITIAKGMGNGFPIGGVIISPDYEAKPGMLGTTFGGNHLACAAAIAVIDVINKENLILNSEKTGAYLIKELNKISKIKEVRGKGLMIGLEFDFNISELRKNLIQKHKIFTGVSGNKTVRLLPPLNLSINKAEHFINSLKIELE